jgi:hypothetical protein
MERNDFLNAIIDDGITEMRHTYTKPYQQIKKDGGIKGFEECRGKTDAEILEAYKLGQQCALKAMGENSEMGYWHWTMYTRQIEWVLNVLSAAYFMHGMDVLIPTTARGVLKANAILS